MEPDTELHLAAALGGDHANRSEEVVWAAAGQHHRNRWHRSAPTPGVATKADRVQLAGLVVSRGDRGLQEGAQLGVDRREVRCRISGQDHPRTGHRRHGVGGGSRVRLDAHHASPAESTHRSGRQFGERGAGQRPGSAVGVLWEGDGTRRRRSAGAPHRSQQPGRSDRSDAGGGAQAGSEPGESRRERRS